MKTSIKISVLALSLLSIVTINANAQDGTSKSTTDGSGIRLSVGLDAGLPLGKLKNNYSWSGGASVEADMPIIRDQFYYTVKAGFNDVFANNATTAPDMQLIPVKAGLKYFPIKNVYIQGEAGAVFVTNKSNLGYTKSAAFVYEPQIGVLFNVGGKNSIDAGVNYQNNSAFYDNGTHSGILGLRVAYSFGL